MVMAIVLTKKKTATEQVIAQKPVEVLCDFADDIDEVGKLRDELSKAQARISEITGEMLGLLPEDTRNKLLKLQKQSGELATKLSVKETELADLLNTYHEDDDADADFKDLGKKHVAVVGKKGNQRKIIDLAKIKKFLDKQKKGLFMELAAVKLGDADKYLTPQEKAATIATDRTKRPVVIEKRL
jgi:hypothetical protein